MKMVKNIIFPLIISITLLIQSICYYAEGNNSIENINQELFSFINDAIRTQDFDLNKIKYYLEEGADPSYFPIENNEGKNTSLSGYIFVSSIKIRKGAITEEKGNEMLRLFFEKGAKIRETDYRLITTSVTNLNLYLKTLLDNGLDPNRRGEGGALTEEVVKGGNWAGIKILKEYGAVLPSQNEIRKLLFFEAVSDDNIKNIENLLKDGFHINETNSTGQTALSIALRYCFFTDRDTETIVYLLKSGADVNLHAKTDYDSDKSTTPLHLAVYHSSLVLENEIKNPKLKTSPQNAKKVLNALLKKDAFVSDTDSDGKTPLHIAAEEDNLYAAKLLIKWGAKKSAKDMKGKTPFDYAKSTQMIKLLSKSDKFSLTLAGLLFFIIAIIFFTCFVFLKFKILNKK